MIPRRCQPASSAPSIPEAMPRVECLSRSGSTEQRTPPQDATIARTLMTTSRDLPKARRRLSACSSRGIRARPSPRASASDFRRRILRTRARPSTRSARAHRRWSHHRDAHVRHVGLARPAPRRAACSENSRPAKSAVLSAKRAAIVSALVDRPIDKHRVRSRRGAPG